MLEWFYSQILGIIKLTKMAKNEALPMREQWSLINNYKMAEFERQKQLERMNDLEKKRQVKQQLDQQVAKKSGVGKEEKEEDRRYYQYITQKTHEMEEKEKKEKFQRYLKRREMEERNKNLFGTLQNSRMENKKSEHLQIGVRSEVERKHKNDVNKKDMLDTLDLQVRHKEDIKRFQKDYELETDQMNLQYQFKEFDKKGYRPKFINLSGRVEGYYQELDHYKRNQENQLDRILVQEAGMKKNMEEERKQQIKEKQRSMMSQEMKQTLDKQINIQELKAKEEKRPNPEGSTYELLEKIFREKQDPYDKREYSEYLRRQIEEKERRNKKNKYMSEEEYLINMKHLNKAVSGAGDRYSLDRSVIAIGERPLQMSSLDLKLSKNEDTNVVKQRIENIRERRREPAYPFPF